MKTKQILTEGVTIDAVAKQLAKVYIDAVTASVEDMWSDLPASERRQMKSPKSVVKSTALEDEWLEDYLETFEKVFKKEVKKIVG